MPGTRRNIWTARSVAIYAHRVRISARRAEARWRKSKVRGWKAKRIPQAGARRPNLPANWEIKLRLGRLCRRGGRGFYAVFGEDGREVRMGSPVFGGVAQEILDLRLVAFFEAG